MCYLVVMTETRASKVGATRAERRESAQEKIVRAAAALLSEGGREAASKRAVAEAAGVQAATIYRLFGDMRGLLDEVASFALNEYLREKVSRAIEEDPVEDLRQAWDLHIGFGLANPVSFTLIYGDPRPGEQRPVDRESFEKLVEMVLRVAEAGRLRVGVERAARMIRSASTGVVLTLIALDPEDRDPALSGASREAILAAVTTDPPAGRDAGGRIPDRAVALKALLTETPDGFMPSEGALLSDWLDRLSDPPS